MDIKRLRLNEPLQMALQVLKLQLELHDGHAIRVNRSVEEVVDLLEQALISRSEPVLLALTRLISLMNEKQIIMFEMLGVDFSPLKQWARSQQTNRSQIVSQPLHYR
ncbi:hypothetical protein [Oceanobacter mangrovi]|uniref:hypothetical protein n=1 Tax=Oceanobacter mangrovi TaxID=2862510 RepID=UPI001C8DC334|nr:hypothetical protein [Oceanobacter mangrovi]